MKLVALIIALFFTGNVIAESRVANKSQPAACPMTEQTQVNINFNSEETDLKQVKSMMDNRLKEVEEIAMAMGIEKVEMQSMNYNLHTNNSGGYNCGGVSNTDRVYRLNGSISFNIHPSDKVIDLLAELNAKGYNGGLNVNKYRRCH